VVVEATHNFCPGCGSPQGAAPAAQAVASTEQRRTITVLFADLAGFTAHTEHSDPEDVRARLTRFHTQAREDVERFGGRVEKLLGDGVFAVFGTPVAHEDDPERAVRAALRLQDSIEGLNAAEPDLRLSVRVAVTTGEAIVQLAEVQDREGVIGDVVNTASRLEAVAAPGTVVVDERTYLASRSAIDFEPLEPVTVKGKVEPLAIWRPSGARSRYGVAVEEDTDTPFVGRASELSLLVDAFERSVGKRSPRLVTVVGEPGVGKSRLVREFRRLVDDRPELVRWRQGRCLPYGEGVTFWAIGELVKAEAGILESEPPESAGAKLRATVDALIDGADDAEWVRSRLAPLAGTGLAEGVERSELFAAWLRFFEALADPNPMVVVIEDLHWADDAVTDFIEHLVDWADDAPILVVATARPELFDDRPGWGGGRRDATTVSLDPLDDDDTKALLAALAGRVVMSAETQQALLERSGGNPLYVTEYVALADERGWFDQPLDDGTLPLPDSIQAVVAARIDLLDPADAAVLQVAAVIGRVFWAGAVSFADVPGDADEVLRRLVQRDLIRPVRRPSMQGQDEYTFAHVLIRDVAYARLTRSERARLHESSARWLEAVSAERAADVAELLAHHLVTAIELSRTDDPDKRRRAYRFLMLAGERAGSLDAPRGLELFRTAVSMAQTDAERGRALLEQGDLELASVEASWGVYQEALAAFRAAGDRQGEAEALSALSWKAWYMGDGEASERLTVESLAVADGLPPSRAAAKAITQAATSYQLAGREEEALDVVERGIAMAAAVGDTPTYARGLITRGSALVQMGAYEGIEEVEEGLRIFLDRGESRRAMSAYNNVATVQIFVGQLEEGRRTMDAAIEYGRQRGLDPHVAWSLMTRCEALFPLGEWDVLLETTAALVEADDARGGTQTGTFARMWASHVAFHRGDTDGALAVREATMPLVRDIGDPQALLPGLANLVEARSAVGDPTTDEAIDEFVAVGLDNPGFIPSYLPHVAGPMIGAGRAADLERLLDAARWGDAPWLDVHLGGVRGLLAEAAGDLEAAIELLSPIWEVGDRLNQRFWSATARVDAARCLLALGRPDEAEQRLVEAEAAAEWMGAARLLRLIDELRGGELADAAKG
jgi:class 3 adenylate cyclase/tetratricopeptide (TPR) repeat protein